MNVLLSPTLGFVVCCEDFCLVLAENKAGKHTISKEVPGAGAKPGAFWEAGLLGGVWVPSVHCT